MLILVAAVLADGCMVPTEPATPRVTDSIPATTGPATTVTPVRTATPVICVPVNTTPYIGIDPILVPRIGDTITFRGTTNLAPGELVTIRISGEVPMCAKCRGDFADSVVACCGGFNRTVVIRNGSCGNNLWSLDVDTSRYDFYADNDYWIGISGGTSPVVNSSFFTLSGIPRPNLTLNLPENDTGGSILRFSGRSNTGNGPGENLLFTLSTDSGKTASFMVPVYPDGTGYSWNYTVNRTALFPYNYLTVNVRSQASPAISIQRVFMYTNEPEFYPYTTNGP